MVVENAGVRTLEATIPKAYEPLFKPARYKVFYGGRGKGASWSFARALLILMAQRRIRVLCAREYQTSIRSSVHQLIADQIDMLGMGAIYRVTREQIECANGGHFIFKGIRNNPAEIKSTEGIDIVWLAEAESTTHESLDILIPTIRSEGSEIWIDFNPDQEQAPTYQRFVVDPPDDAIVRKCTYRDNPFLPDTLRREMEYTRSHNPDKYEWVWEGNPRRITAALVYGGHYRIEEFETPADVERFYYGADWGFAQDPSTMVRSFVVDRTLYVDYEAYGIGVELDDLPQLFASVPGAKEWPSVADSARPETISYMQHHGYPKMRGAPKPKGSVEDGIARLREFDEIVVHPRCRHAIEEFGSYSYKRDKLTGDILPVVDKRDDHCLAAGTMIATIAGEKPIELVEPGDMILTRAGYRRCEAAWMASPSAEVREVLMVDGSRIVGTAEHKVWTPFGFKPIDALRYGDVVSLLWNDQRSSSSRGEYTGDGQRQSVGPTVSTTGAARQDSGCTLRYGRERTDRCREGATFTTLTETRSTMTSRIYDVSPLERMSRYTHSTTIGDLGQPRTFGRSVERPQSGTGLKRAARGTRSTEEGLSANESLSRRRAVNADDGFAISQGVMVRGSARMRASRHGGENLGLISLNERVHGAARDFHEANTPRPSTVLGHVVCVRHLKDARPVYDLTVEGEHEFFANGVLVHNCLDALRYSHYTRAKRWVMV